MQGFGRFYAQLPHGGHRNKGITADFSSVARQSALIVLI
jgi:hypothetical protein